MDNQFKDSKYIKEVFCKLVCHRNSRSGFMTLHTKIFTGGQDFVAEITKSNNDFVCYFDEIWDELGEQVKKHMVKE